MTDNDFNRLPFDRKVLSRFFSKIKISAEHVFNGSPCWDWQNNKNNKGYGMFSYQSKKRLAHLIAYGLFVEIISKDREHDHLCCRPVCCNPAHLEPVTHRENLTRSEKTTNGRNYCKRGHELSGENVFINSRGSRQCYKCARFRRYGRTDRKAFVPITHCKHGHEYTEENTVRGKSGWRNCRTCRNSRRSARKNN